MRLSIALEWDLIVAEYILKTCLSFCHSLEAVVANNGAHIE
jgi:hypothetical protein